MGIPFTHVGTTDSVEGWKARQGIWLMGTHQGGIQQQHLDYYLDEFTFRFNRRRSQARGLLFHRLVQQAVASGPASYHQIIAASDPAPALEAT